jgi:hypothetical protein
MNETVVNLKRKRAKIEWQYSLLEEPNLSGNVCSVSFFGGAKIDSRGVELILTCLVSLQDN